MNDPSAQISSHRSRRWPTVVAVLAVLVPGVPIVAGFVIPSRTASAGTATSARLSPVAPSALAARGGAAAQPSSGLSSGSGALVALVLHGTMIRASPAGLPLAKLTTRTEFGSPEALWVVRRTTGWLGVISPLAGNGRLGWIPRAVATLTRVSWELKVSLSARRLTVIDGGQVRAQYTVAIGRPQAPTPTGRFEVTDRLQTHDPAGPYGCCILALSAQSPHAIQGWSGGSRIAIHSTPDTASIGQPVSHGCLRLTIAEGRWLMGHVPLGTPTLISS